MDSTEEDALLFLIYQHLKVHGHQKAANALKKSVAQVEAPEECSSLHDMYTGWTKLCSLAQEPKQEIEVDSTTVKKRFKMEAGAAAEGLSCRPKEEEEEETKPLITPETPDTKPPAGAPEPQAEGEQDPSEEPPCLGKTSASDQPENQEEEEEQEEEKEEEKKEEEKEEKEEEKEEEEEEKEKEEEEEEEESKPQEEVKRLTESSVCVKLVSDTIDR